MEITTYNKHHSAPFLRALVESPSPSLLGRGEPTTLSNQQQGQTALPHVAHNHTFSSPPKTSIRMSLFSLADHPNGDRRPLGKGVSRRPLRKCAICRLIVALEPWLTQVVIIGGWAHRLYLLHPSAQHIEYLPLTTLDTDIAVSARLKVIDTDVRGRLIANGFEEERLGQDQPPATRYCLGREDRLLR